MYEQGNFGTLHKKHQNYFVGKTVDVQLQNHIQSKGKLDRRFEKKRRRDKSKNEF